MTIRNEGGWRIKRTESKDGCIFEYQKQVSLSGAAENIDIFIPFEIALNRISYSSDDTTAKSFATRVFNGDIDMSTYDELGSWTNNTDISLTYSPLGEEGRYTQMPIIIRTAISASTAAKTLTIKIVVRKL